MNIEKNIKFIEQQESIRSESKAYKRLLSLFDEDTFSEIDPFLKSSDDYAEVIAGYGLISGSAVYAFSQDCDKDGGAISKAQLKKIKKVYELAAKTGIPIIGLYDSIGAKINEGNELIYDYGEVLKLNHQVSGVVPKISVILGASLGTNAILASSADFVIMQKSARLGISTIDKGSSAKDAETTGVSHITAINETDAINKTKRLISMLPLNNLSKPSTKTFNESINNLKELDELSKSVCKSTEKDIMKKIIHSICDDKSFLEMQSGYGLSLIVGLGRIGGNTVGIISSNIYNNGVIDADACSKASRTLRFCDAFSIPVLTIINSRSFESLKEATMLSCVYSEATTAKINLIVGEAYGSVYIALAGKGSGTDVVFSWPNAIVSPLEPKTAVHILLNSEIKKLKDPINDKGRLIKAYEETQASAFIASSEGFIDDVIRPSDTRAKLISVLDFLAGKRVSTLPKKHSNILL